MILWQIRHTSSPEALTAIVFSWLQRKAPEIGVHRELTFEKAAELANRVGYHDSAAMVLQAAIRQQQRLSLASSQPGAPTPTA